VILENVVSSFLTYPQLARLQNTSKKCNLNYKSEDLSTCIIDLQLWRKRFPKSKYLNIKNVPIDKELYVYFKNLHTLNIKYYDGSNKKELFSNLVGINTLSISCRFEISNILSYLSGI
jgi:hypothetical protein